MNNVLDRGSGRRMIMEETLEKSAAVSAQITETAREMSASASALYERVIAFLCGVIAFLRLPVVAGVVRAAAGIGAAAFLIRAVSAAVNGAPALAGIVLPLAAALVLAATVLRVRPNEE